MYKVLVFGMTENPGGVESVIMNYYRNIDRTKIQFDFLCNSYEKVAYEDELIALGGKTIHFPARSRNFIQYRKKLTEFFAQHAKEYQAIWVNVCSLANIDYLKMAKKYGIPRRIIHSHNSKNMDGKLRGMLHKRNRRKIERYATDFWSCSDDAATWFYKPELCKKVITIANAIDVSKLSFSEEKRNQFRKQLGWENCYIIGNVGRLHFQKNQTFILDIFKELLEECPDARLVLVGQGEDEEALKQKANLLEISDKINFAGVQYDIQGWLSTFDAFLFPSLFEGLGVVALEAQANGIPTLASTKVIPQEVKINPNFNFFALEESAAEWAKQILRIRLQQSRLPYDMIEKNFTEIGYNIAHEAKKLETLFMEK